MLILPGCYLVTQYNIIDLYDILLLLYHVTSMFFGATQSALSYEHCYGANALREDK